MIDHGLKIFSCNPEKRAGALRFLLCPLEVRHNKNDRERSTGMHRGGPTATGRGVVFDEFSFGLRDPSQLGKEGASFFDPGALPLSCDG